MSKHHTQRSRKEQMDQVKAKILAYGGWAKIRKGQNERWLIYLIAQDLDCTFKKAKEYVDIVVNAAIAKARLGEEKADESPDILEK